MPPKKQKRRPKPLKPAALRQLDAVETLLDDGVFDEAYAKMVSFTKKYPDSVEGWSLYAAAADEMGDVFSAWFGNRELLALQPHEEQHVYNGAVLSLQLIQVFSIEYYVNVYLMRWPKGTYAAEIRSIQEHFSPAWEGYRANSPLAQEATLEGLLMFESGELLTNHGYYQEGRKLTRTVAQKWPVHPEPLNNISRSYGLEGKLSRALQVAEEVLAAHPGNLNALCNKLQYLVRLGRNEEALGLCDELAQATPEASEDWLRIIEALAYAGADEAILNVYGRIPYLKEHPLPPMFMHFVGTAYARLGQFDKAQPLWEAALEEMPDMDLFDNNLFDLDMPPGIADGPAYFEPDAYMPPGWLERILQALEVGERKGDEGIKREMGRLMKSSPEIDIGFSILLDRGTGDGREMALEIAPHYPVMGLVSFALGQSGTDEQRLRAAVHAYEHGLLPSKKVMLYKGGEPHEQVLTSFEIYYDPDVRIADVPEEALSYYEQVGAALGLRDGEAALPLIEEALALVPDNRTFLYFHYLTLTMMMADDEEENEEADAALDYLIERHPDYVFARCLMAVRCAHRGKLDEIDQWLEPVMLLDRLHASEFLNLATAQIESAQARGTAEAFVWLERWEEYSPETLPEPYAEMLEDYYAMLDRFDSEFGDFNVDDLIGRADDDDQDNPFLNLVK